MPLPMNGVKTHPLTEHAWNSLATLRRSPVPSQEINAGVVNRLLREALIEIVELPSPYKTHKGRKISHAQITEAGIARLAERS